MTQQELLKSLNTEQGAALNAILTENFNLRGATDQLAALTSENAALKSANAALTAVKAELDMLKKPEQQKRMEALLAQKAAVEAELAKLAERTVVAVAKTVK